MNGQGYSFKTHSYDTPGPRFPYAVIIRDAIIDAIWNGELSAWKSAMGTFGDRALGRDFTPDEIYIWVNQNPGDIEKSIRQTEYFHKSYSQNAKYYIDLLKAIVNGRKRVLDKYKAAENATQSDIGALEQKFKLPDVVQEWLNEHKQSLTEDEKRLFNIQSADSGADAGAGTSADAEATTGVGGRRRRKTSFRRRRMSRCRSSKSKSKSKSKKSRKSRKCVR